MPPVRSHHSCSQFLPKPISPRPALQDLTHWWVSECSSRSGTSAEQGRGRGTVFLPAWFMGLVHDIPCPIAFGLLTPCGVGHWPAHQITCQRNSVPFSGFHLLFSSSQAAEAYAGGQQRPYKWEQGCAQSPQPQVPSPGLSRPSTGRGCKWSWTYRTPWCLSCRKGQGQEVHQQHSEGSAAEQELQVEKDHVHSWWTPLQSRKKNAAMATWKLVTAQLSLLRYQTFRAAEWKPEKLSALTFCRW